MSLKNASTKTTSTTSTTKPKKALNFGSMAEVYDAVLAGHRVYSVNVNFSKGKTFAPGSALKFIGGAFTATTANEGERAFMKFMPMGYTIDKTSGERKYISEGTTTMFKLVEEPEDMDELAELKLQLSQLKEEVRLQRLSSIVVSENIDFEAWQAFAADNNVGGEPSFEFNLDHWDRAFVSQLGAKTAAAQVKSLSVFFVLSVNPNGTAKCSDIVSVHKPYLGEPVMGRFFETKVVSALWNESVHYTSRYKNEVSAATVAKSFDSVLALQNQIKGVGSSMKNQVEAASKNAFGNKAVANAKAAFETELEAGKWNKFIEARLHELAKSTQFPGWSILACKGYILDMQEKFDDAVEFVDEVVNIKGVATSVKSVAVVQSVADVLATKPEEVVKASPSKLSAV